jgi:hypothetical protein
VNRRITLGLVALGATLPFLALNSSPASAAQTPVVTNAPSLQSDGSYALYNDSSNPRALTSLALGKVTFGFLPQDVLPFGRYKVSTSWGTGVCSGATTVRLSDPATGWNLQYDLRAGSAQPSWTMDVVSTNGQRLDIWGCALVEHVNTVGSPVSSPAPVPTPAPAPAPKSAPAPKPSPRGFPAGTLTNGTFVVNKQIYPGRYRVVPTGGWVYWELQDGYGNLVDNNIGTDSLIVDIPASATYTKVSGAIYPIASGPGVSPFNRRVSGTFLVGYDIAPGAYRVSACDGRHAYWARMASPYGSYIIDNDLVSIGSTIVNIRPTDPYVDLDGCVAPV